MAEVTLTIGERRHTIACRDGEEAHLRALGARLDRHWPIAARAAGTQGGERAMLLLALIMADSLDEAERTPSGDGGASEAALARVAERLEALADTLERDGQSA
jgi:cell division protein ZapA